MYTDARNKDFNEEIASWVFLHLDHNPSFILYSQYLLFFLSLLSYSEHILVIFSCILLKKSVDVLRSVYLDYVSEIKYLMIGAGGWGFSCFVRNSSFIFYSQNALRSSRGGSFRVRRSGLLRVFCYKKHIDVLRIFRLAGRNKVLHDKVWRLGGFALCGLTCSSYFTRSTALLSLFLSSHFGVHRSVFYALNDFLMLFIGKVHRYPPKDWAQEIKYLMMEQWECFCTSCVWVGYILFLLYFPPSSCVSLSPRSTSDQFFRLCSIVLIF